MISETLLTLAVAAATAGPPAHVLLRAEAAKVPACRTTRVDDKTVAAPLFSKDSQKCPVALVATDVVELRDLADGLEQEHLSRKHAQAVVKGRPEMDFRPVLDRIIDLRLILLEAREMGIDRDPGVVAKIAEHNAAKLRLMLQERISRRVGPDPKEVERLYREAVRQWDIKSVLFDKEEDAKAFRAALDKGGSFDDLAKKAVADKKAKGGEKAELTSKKQMIPEVADAAEKAKQGVPFGPLKVPSGWAFLRVDGTKYPAGDKAARAQAESMSRGRLQREAVRKLYLSLKQKFVKVDEPLLKELDFEAKGEAGFKALLEDKRSLATIAGEKPVTVADLTKEIQKHFFHGLKTPIEEKRVNPLKADEFEKLLGARLFAKEAAAQKLASTAEYREDAEHFQREILFAVFVERAIIPDVKVMESESLAYYDAHKAELTTPEMLKLSGIAFPTAAGAQSALDKLKAGADFAWLRSSAQGQLPPDKCSLTLDGRTYSASGVAPDLLTAISGARAGDYRLFSPKDGEVYVVRVDDRTPPATEPYQEAREDISKRLFAEKVDKGIRDYAQKLRKVQKVDVLITRVTL